MSKAFSLIELLISCVILAIVIGISIPVYKNLVKNTQDAMQDRDQVVLQKAVEAFHTTGGNLSYLSNRRSTSEQAAALTKFLRNEIDDETKTLESNYRTIKGTVYNKVLPDDMMLVPYSSNEARARVRISGSQLIFIPANQAAGVAGFIAVSTNSELGKQELANYSQSANNNLLKQDVQKIVTTQNTAGSKYADKNAYIWNEDTTNYTLNMGTPTTVSTAGAYTLTIAVTPKDAYPTYWNYAGGSANVMLSCKTAGGITRKLSLQDLTSVKAIFVNGSDTCGIARDISLTVTTDGNLTGTVNFADIVAANGWHSDTYTLLVTAKSKTSDFSDASGGAAINASKTTLNVNATLTDANQIFEDASDKLVYSVDDGTTNTLTTDMVLLTIATGDTGTTLYTSPGTCASDDDVTALGSSGLAPVIKPN